MADRDPLAGRTQLGRRETLIGLGAALTLLTRPRQIRAQAVFRPIGSVSRLKGTGARLQGTDREDLLVGLPVAFQDTIRTGANSRARIELDDESVFTLGDDTEFVIDSFVYEPAGTGASARFTLTAGAFRMVTGLITGQRGASLTVTTPVATIGVRGTDFWGLQTETSLQLALLEGGPITLTTPAGTVTLTAPLDFAQVTAPGVAPTPPRTLSQAELNAAASTVAF